MGDTAFHAGSTRGETPARTDIGESSPTVYPHHGGEAPANAGTMRGTTLPSSSGPGRQPFTLDTAVRICSGVPERKPTDGLLAGLVCAFLVALIAGCWPASAEAHQVKRTHCAVYASVHAFMVGVSGARGPAFGRCWRKAQAHLLTHPLPDRDVPAVLRRIRGCESGDGPNGRPDYTAQNRRSTASGAYQYLDSTWGGHLGYAKARYAPPRIQDWRAIRDYRRVGTTPWAASRGCWS